MIESHRDILRSLSAAEKRELTRLSNGAGFAHLAGHIAIILMFVGLNVVLDGGWRLVAMIGQGIAMVFLFTAMHECSHRTAFRTRWINDVVGTVIGFVLFLLPKWFFYFHQEHHKFTQDPQRDPELASPKPDCFLGYLLHLSGMRVWRDHFVTLVKIAVGKQSDDYVPKSKRVIVRREAIIFLGLYAISLPLFWQMGMLLQYWLIPLVLGQPFLRLYLLAEHAGCDHSVNMLVNTRTIITSPIVRFLAWNMPYHSEHHSFVAVPFHRLPQFHRYLHGHHGVLSAGYRSFHREFLDDVIR